MDPMIFYFFHRENEEVRSKTKLEGNRKCVVPFFLRFLIGWGGGVVSQLDGDPTTGAALEGSCFQMMVLLEAVNGL